MGFKPADDEARRCGSASAIGLGEPIGWEALTALALVLTALFMVLILPALRAR